MIYQLFGGPLDGEEIEYEHPPKIIAKEVWTEREGNIAIAYYLFVWRHFRYEYLQEGSAPIRYGDGPKDGGDDPPVGRAHRGPTGGGP